MAVLKQYENHQVNIVLSFPYFQNTFQLIITLKNILKTLKKLQYGFGLRVSMKI